MGEAVGKTRDDRSEPRDEVLHRTRASRADGTQVELVVVNISARGLMARCGAPIEPGERIRVRLPEIGSVPAEVRWALGGRIGCLLDHIIPFDRYPALLAVMTKAF